MNPNRKKCMSFFSQFFYFILHKKYFFIFLFCLFPLSIEAQFTKEQCQAFPLGECVSIGMNPINPCPPGKKGVGSCQSSQFETCCAEDKNPSPPITNEAQCTSQEGVCEDGNSCGPKAFAIGECASNKACCKQSPSYEDPSINASFDYTPLEPIPGTEGMDTSTLKGFLEGLFLFVLWSAGIASLFMISIGGFWYMTSAGNTSRVTEAKNIIAGALWGLVIILIAWLILYVINPDLVRIDLSSLETLFIEGKVYYSYPQKKDVVGPGGSGTCGKATTSGNCSISNMQQCPTWNPEAASRVCLFESSGGNAFAESGSDKCADGSSFSFGLFQINIIANGEKLNGCDPNQAFKKYDGSPLGSSRGNNGGALEYCTNSKGVRYVCKWNCKVVDTNMYNVCKQAAFDTNQNISVACSLYRSGGWKPWPVTKKICNL